MQSVDYLEGYVGSRTLGVVVVLGLSVSVGILFMGSFINSLGIQIKTFSNKIQKDNFAIAVEKLSTEIKLLLPEFFNNLIPDSDKVILMAKNFLVNIFQNILALLGSAGNFIFIIFIDYFSCFFSFINIDE